MGQAFLGANRGNDLRIRVQLDPEPPHVTPGKRFAEILNPPGNRVAVIGRLTRFSNQGLNCLIRRWDVGVAESEVDDIAPAEAYLGLAPVDLGEGIRGQ